MSATLSFLYPRLYSNDFLLSPEIIEHFLHLFLHAVEDAEVSLQFSAVGEGAREIDVVCGKVNIQSLAKCWEHLLLCDFLAILSSEESKQIKHVDYTDKVNPEASLLGETDRTLVILLYCHWLLWLRCRGSWGSMDFLPLHIAMERTELNQYLINLLWFSFFYYWTNWFFDIDVDGGGNCNLCSWILPLQGP